MSILSVLGIIGFNFILLSLTLLVFFWCKFGGYFVEEERLAKQSKQLIGYAWKLTLLLCSPWMQIQYDGLEEYKAGLSKSAGRPRILLANHQSFLDTILVCATCPISEVAVLKMFGTAGMFKMPIIGTIFKACGHFVVPFKDQSTGANATSDFSVDKDKMSGVMAQAEAWVSSGNITAWFPEGAMNKRVSDELPQFRAGGFVLATKTDVEIWCVALSGLEVCWPRKGAVGGRPARMRVKTFCMSKSSHEMFAQAGITGEREQCLHLANEAHACFTKELKAFREDGWVSVSPIEAPKIDKKKD
jgi:1-acyl-sn-glycerol-3-phosphate acyltransferase